MSRGDDTRRMNREDSSGEDEHEPVGTLFEEMLTASPSATFYIAITSSHTERRQQFRPARMFPILIGRNLDNGNININLNLENENHSFVLELVTNLLNTLRGRERIRKGIVNNKPYRFKKDMEAQECTICLNEFKKKQRIRKLDCEHHFHTKCIDKWLLKGNPSCPICRGEPFKNDPE